MKKIIFAIFMVLFLAGMSFAQPTVWISEGTADVRTYDAGFVCTFYFNDVDSAETLTARIYDFTYFAQDDSIVITYEYVSSVDDTLSVFFDALLYYDDGSGANSYLELAEIWDTLHCVGLAATGTPTQDVYSITANKYGQVIEITVTEKSASSDNDANGTLVLIIEGFRPSAREKVEWY